MLARNYRRQSGVTLLELMIVVVVIAILTAIAFPNYRDFVDRAKRNEAKALLLEIAQNQERFYLQNSTYGTLAQLGYGTPLDTDSGTYRITVTGPDASNFDAATRPQSASDSISMVAAPRRRHLTTIAGPAHAKAIRAPRSAPTATTLWCWSASRGANATLLWPYR